MLSGWVLVWMEEESDGPLMSATPYYFWHPQQRVWTRKPPSFLLPRDPAWAKTPEPGQGRSAAKRGEERQMRTQQQTGEEEAGTLLSKVWALVRCSGSELLSLRGGRAPGWLSYSMMRGRR